MKSSDFKYKMKFAFIINYSAIIRFLIHGIYFKRPHSYRFTVVRSGLFILNSFEIFIYTIYKNTLTNIHKKTESHTGLSATFPPRVELGTET